MDFSFEKNLSKKEKTEMVKINDKDYLLTNKPSGNLPSQEIKSFVIDQWEKPRNEYNPHLNEGLKHKEVDFIKGDDEKIIALCSYAIDRGIDNGKIDLTLVREDYRNKGGVGLFLTKRAIEKIIEFAEKKKGFIPPLKISADAETEEGFNLMKKIQQEYGDRVIFNIQEIYKEEDEEDPEN